MALKRKILICVLCAALICTFTAMPASAGENSGNCQKVYTSLGDSIGAGYDIFNGHSGVHGYDKSTSFAFPRVAAKKLNMKPVLYSHIGFTTNDVKALLGLECDKEAFSYRTHYRCDTCDVPSSKKVIKNIRRSELVTVEVGINDYTTAALNQACYDVFGVGITTGGGKELPGLNTEEALELLKKGDIAGFMEIAIKDAKTIGKYKEFCNCIVKEIKKAGRNYKKNYAAIMKKIRKENRSCVILGIGLYNPYKGAVLSDRCSAKVGDAVSVFVNSMNRYIKLNSKVYGYSYVDITGVKDAEGKTILEALMTDPHPDEEEHADIADRVVEKYKAVKNSRR